MTRLFLRFLFSFSSGWGVSGFWPGPSAVFFFLPFPLPFPFPCPMASSSVFPGPDVKFSVLSDAESKRRISPMVTDAMLETWSTSVKDTAASKRSDLKMTLLYNMWHCGKSSYDLLYNSCPLYPASASLPSIMPVCSSLSSYISSSICPRSRRT